MHKSLFFQLHRLTSAHFTIIAHTQVPNIYVDQGQKQIKTVTKGDTSLTKKYRGLNNFTHGLFWPFPPVLEWCRVEVNRRRHRYTFQKNIFHIRHIWGHPLQNIWQLYSENTLQEQYNMWGGTWCKNVHVLHPAFAPLLLLAKRSQIVIGECTLLSMLSSFHHHSSLRYGQTTIFCNMLCWVS